MLQKFAGIKRNLLHLSGVSAIGPVTKGSKQAIDKILSAHTHITMEWSLSLLFLLTLSAVSNAQISNDVLNSIQDASTNKLAKLYATIRNVALPPISPTATGNEPVNNRLVMVIPGKVLNYYDYFPGDRYEASLEDPHHDGTQVIIPPRVQENMFQLADAVPGVYPLRGSDTGESMATIYENVLNQLEVKGFNQKTQAEKERYVTAIDYLAEELADPLDVTRNVTRFGLYRRSQDLYNTKRLEMEDTIDARRRELPAIEYERWFQRNYPGLNSQVEGAYTEWLIFGQKEIVELYKSYLDVQSPGIDLEEARMSLRASGLAALDRSRTIYPVSFTPSNWYRYLTNVTAVDLAQAERVREQQGYTRDELLALIGEFESKKRVLQALKNAIHASGELTADYNMLESNLSMSNEELSEFANRTERLRQRCLSSRIKAKASGQTTVVETPECVEYENLSEDSNEEIFGNSELYACVRDLDFQVNKINETQLSFDSLIQAIDEEVDALQSQLRRASPKFPSLARHAADTQDQLDSRWLRFEFDSKKTISTSDSRSSHFSVAASFKASGWFWSVGASSSYSRSQSSFQSDMNTAEVKVSGELLRVTVNRPWFKPSLFKSTQFQIKTDENLRVSPGQLTERDFITAIQPGVTPAYLLPQYTTGFLLSRNIDIVIRNKQQSNSAKAVRSSFSASFSGRVGIWSASVQTSGGSQRRTTRYEMSDEGIRISIPGAQLIGYYTQVVPRFPVTDN